MATPKEKKERRDVLALLKKVLPEIGSTITVESMIGIFGNKSEVRRVLSQYSNPPGSTKNWMNLTFVPGDEPKYRRDEPTEAQLAEEAYWIEQTWPRGRPSTEKAKEVLIVYERAPDGSFKPVDVEPNVAEKLLEFAAAKRAAELKAA